MSDLTFTKYQEISRTTAVYPPHHHALVHQLMDEGKTEAAAAVMEALREDRSNVYYTALGLCGESGEVADKIKKVIRDKQGRFSDEDKEMLSKEIGDVLWYAAGLAYDLGLNLGDIAQQNLDKLLSRRERDEIQGSGDNR